MQALVVILIAAPLGGYIAVKLFLATAIDSRFVTAAVTLGAVAQCLLDYWLGTG